MKTREDDCHPELRQPLGARVVGLALPHIGLKETGPNQGPPVERFAGGRQEPYCAHFIATLFRCAGHALPGDIAPTKTQHNPIARCQTMWERFVEAGWTVDENAPLLPGDVGFMNQRGDSDAGEGWHVFLVTASSADLVQCISGNWGKPFGGIKRHAMRRSDYRVVGFARVPE